MSKKYRFGIVILATLLLAALFAFAPGALAEIRYVSGGDESCEHSWINGHETKTANCHESGEKTYTCEKCNGTGIEDLGVDLTNHDGEEETRDAVTANCHAKGYSGDIYCKGCGNKKSDGHETEIDLTNHDGEEETRDAVTANCHAKGYSGDIYCKGCGNKKSDGHETEIDLTNHDGEEETKNAVAANCHAKGYSGDVYCKGCGNKKSDGHETEIDLTNHDGEEETKNAVVANCHAKGYSGDIYCKGCGNKKSDGHETEIDLTNHDGEEEIKNTKVATCSETGYTGDVYCKGCGNKKSDGSVIDKDPNNHTWNDGVVTTAATCSAKGVKTYTCTGCQTTKTEEIPIDANNHTWDDGVVTTVATCSAKGVKTYTCTGCQTTKTEEIDIDANNHDWAEPTYAWAEDNSTCTATRICTRDASHIETETVTATVTEVEATYTAEGKRTYTATFTNTAFAVQTNEEIIPKLVNYITAFDKLGEIYYSYKPELKAALAEMWPTTQATLSDGTKVTATLKWTKDSAPAGYAEKEGDGKYVFTAASVTTEGNYPLADGLAMPTCTLVVKPATFSDDYADYTYRLNAANEVTIIKCTVKENITDVVVPAKFGDNQPVTYIEAEAFKKNEALVRLVLPKGLLSIGDKAFAGCTALETLVVPDSLQSVGTEMLKSVKTLVSLTLQTDMESTLTADNTLTHTVQSGELLVPYTVEMPTAFTDFIVNSSVFTMDCDYTVAADHSITVNPAAFMNVLEERRLKNLGTVTNNGNINNWGTIVTCGGEWPAAAPVDEEDGKFITTHIFEKGICTGCGIKEEIIVTELTITYTGSGLDKVYDKTRNVTVTGSDFRISGTRSGHTSVRIAGIRAAYDAPDVGDRKITISFTLGGDDVDWYTCSDITVSAKITPKPLIITPNEGQKKFYGAADPTYFTGTVKGLLEGDSISGRLARETGEDVGKYKIIQGTIDAGTNYDVQVQEAYFNIEAKSINSTDVGLVTIGNQKYTGQPIKPTITLRYGTLTLKQDTDFKAEYTDNVKVGTAKVKLTGIGNYTGDRETSFRILDTGSGGGSGGGGGGGSSGGDDDDDFGTGSDEFEDEDEDEEDEDTGKLILNDVNYGDVLLGLEGEPRAFTLMDETDGQGHRVLTIMPDPMTDEETGDSIYLDEDNMRERYNEMHLRISPTLAQTLTNQGISEIVYQLDQADLHIPLASLVAELPLDAPDPEMSGEGVAAEDGAEEMEVAPRALEISAYDICVEQIDAIKLTNTETRAALLAEGIIVPGGADEAGAATAEPAEAPAEGEVVKQLDPRVDALLLSERETAQLDDYQSLMVPAYRARVRVILEGQEPEPTGLKDSNGEPLPQMVPKALPDGVYPKDIRMMLLPDEVPQGESTEVQTVRAAVLNTPWDPSAITFETARFEDLDGMTYAAVPLERDGIYAVTMPELPEDDYEDDFEDDEDEEEYVDFA